ncbi:MAG: preprotein translocase subunit YajC [Cyclobacteriaceae bacterium]|nr:preprotein translocase subunit YajC [Cyclobacteriaceae bacterium]MCK5277633.1 preprotein translocase subunit YajC [Cyclobacteriaceae bacterium]MCK5370855.1 preprotein translocase subunit YajC [Cyclobacteriaceae bacterium]MCK5467381.1 preprotein translocase subunit YajC [Cyclobacteriaceae bacterium]
MLGILLQAGGGSAMTGNLVLIGGIIVIFYFFMIRPQQKKQKDQKKFLEEIKKGDMAVTTGGIHGKVAAIDDDTVLLEVDRGTKIKVEKGSMSLEASKKYAEKKM